MSPVPPLESARPAKRWRDSRTIKVALAAMLLAALNAVTDYVTSTKLLMAIWVVREVLSILLRFDTRTPIK